MISEKRKLGRWQLGIKAQIKLEGDSSFVPCTVSDINFKGMRILLAKKINPDSFVKITIIFSDDLILSAQVWVVWHKAIDGHNIYGLYFSQIKDSDKERLYQFVRNNFKQAINGQWWKGLDEKKGGEDMEDRRIFERLAANLAVRYLDAQNGREGEAQAVDISAKGIGLSSREEIKEHAPLEIWLKIEQRDEPLYTRGEVVWAKEAGPNEYRAGINLERADLLGLSRALRAH